MLTPMIRDSHCHPHLVSCRKTTPYDKIARHHKSRGEDAAVDVSVLYIDDSICIYLNVRVYA